ncbi:MAG TPA: YdeI/OmpD-associated family protein [Gemmatimonadaceae bacterium]|nr:YdeI/OmpD-associated family protein [Gemmatimonadaceae bacterium]
MPQKRATKKRKSSAKPAVAPIQAFKTPKDFSAWLEKNHGKSTGLWVRIAKKDSGIKSITYAEALEVALCYGWIDALKLPENEKTWLQRFLPRRPKSLWSKINREKATALMECRRMRPPGFAEIERAKADGRWESAYDSPSRAEVPPEFQNELDRNPKAKAFFETLDRANRYAIIWRIQTVKKDETRQTRMRNFIEMLEKGEKLH